VNELVSESRNEFISIERKSVCVECEFRHYIALTEFLIYVSHY